MNKIGNKLFFIIALVLLSNLPVKSVCLPLVEVFGPDAPQQCADACGVPDCYFDTVGSGDFFLDNACTQTCALTPPICGNGLVEGNEECDDGANIPGDGCNPNCMNEGICGNNILEGEEACDDGNTSAGDGCSSTCRIEQASLCLPLIEVFGPDAPQQCSDACGVPLCYFDTQGEGDFFLDNVCTQVCGSQICGNGILESAEECDDGNIVNNDGCSSSCTTEAEICHTIDFDNLQTGEIVENQYSNLKLTISANNKKRGHPDKAIIFDSANPSGGDDDLGTPNEDFGGPGIGSGGEQGEPGENNTALNKFLIIAEDIVDSNNDGFVDDPDDEAEGGSIYFNFDEPVKVSSVKLVDIDNKSNDVKGFNSSGAEIFKLEMSDLNHNSVQTINVNQTTYSTSKLELKFRESGAVDTLTYCLENSAPAACGDGTVDPGEECDDGNTTNGDGCSSTCTSEISCHIIDFNNFATGLVLDDELSNIGVTVSALNDYSSSDPYNPNGVGNHPHKVTIFDSANATGNDTDLGTPHQDFGGSGIGSGGDQGSPGENNTALGKLLIIAENDYDNNNDGLIDSPDDELSGGEIYFDFNSPAKINSVTAIDIENSSSYIKALNASNSQVFKKYFNNYGDNSVQMVDSGQDSFTSTRLIIHMKDLGAIDNINFCK